MSDYKIFQTSFLRYVDVKMSVELDIYPIRSVFAIDWIFKKNIIKTELLSNVRLPISNFPFYSASN